MTLTKRPERRHAGRAWRLAVVPLALVAAVVLASGEAATGKGPSLSIEASPIPAFDPETGETRFGALDYVGGFSYSSSDSRLSGVSAIRLRDGRSRFLAVTDTGYWFRGAVERDARGRPIGFSGAEISPILGPEGEAQTRRKGLADAEGLALDGDRALVSFERDHRIDAYDANDPFESRSTAVNQPIPREELRSNAGIEAIAVEPAGSPGGRRTVIVTEQSIDADGNLFAAILGAGGGLFKVKREPPWHVTDGAFLPGGDLLLLERRYQSFGRVGMRIRRIAGSALAPGALVDGPVLIDANLGKEIDNMEGLDVSVGTDGATYLALVSDDNGSFFQRNLYLEFRLADDVTATGSVGAR